MSEHPTMAEYPFPLRPDCTVTLWLPKDLKQSEIDRLRTYMEAIAAPEPAESSK